MMASTRSVFIERLSTTSVNNDTLISECQNIASEIISGKIRLHTFVEDLGPLFIDKTLEKRKQSVAALSVVLSKIPKDFLNESELTFLSEFYCERLKDQYTIIPDALTGILALVQMDHLPPNVPSIFASAISNNVQCQAYGKEDRYKIYLIFSILIENRAENLKSMGPDFVYGVISVIENERDPNNLMFLFKILPKFMKKFPLGHLTEEMFEILACYFPVDFKPSDSERRSITREDLANSLAPCLCAVPEFAEFCIPLINDKLSSDLRVAKLDSLALLCQGAPIFGIEGLKSHLDEIWITLRKEIIPGRAEEIRDIGLKALKIIINVICTDETTYNNFLDKIFSDTLLTKSSANEECFNRLKIAEKLFETIASSNKESCVKVLNFIVPLCLGQYSTRTLLEDKITVLETFNKFLKLCSDFEYCIQDIPELAWTDVPQTYFNELNVRNNELKMTALTGLMLQKKCLNQVHRNFLYERICDEIETGCDEVKNLCFKSISDLAVLYPSEILSLLEQRLPLQKSGTDATVEICRLKALSSVSRIPELGNKILPQILSVATTNDNYEISLAALKCLNELVSIKQDNFDIHHFLYNSCNIIEKLTALEVSNADEQRLFLISNICQTIIRKFSIENQIIIVDKYFPHLLADISEAKFIIFTGFFIPLRQKVQLNVTDELLERLFNTSVLNKETIARQASCKLLSVLLNKMINDEQFGQIMTHLKDKIVNIVESNDVDRTIKQAAVVLLMWLTKATITKGSCNSQEFLALLTGLLKHMEVGYNVANEYKILIKKTDDTFTKENYCNIKFLYKQRVMEYLLHENKNFYDSCRENYLIALIYLLQEVPDELLFMHSTELVPLLIESLSLDNRDLVLSSLTLLKVWLQTRNMIFIDKMQSFIPRLLKLLTHEAMKIRIVALECLIFYCDYPIIEVQKYKQDVLESLAIAIDDRKRLVRKAAVEARLRWFLVGAPGENRS